MGGTRVLVGPAVSRLRWRRNVEAAARLQVAQGGEDVDVHAAIAFAVLDRGPRIAARFEARPGRVVELLEDGFDLCVGWSVLGRSGDSARRVPVLELQRVGHSGDHVGVSSAALGAIAEVADPASLTQQVLHRNRPRLWPRLPRVR